MAEPRPGSAERIRTAWRALRRRRSRAGALPRGHFDHAPVPPLVMLSASAPASRPVALAAALASLSSSRAFLYLPKYLRVRVRVRVRVNLRGARGFGWDDAAAGRGSGAAGSGAAGTGAPGHKGGGRARSTGRPTGPRGRQGRRPGACRGGLGRPAAARAARGGPGGAASSRGLRYSNRPVALAHVVGVLRVRVVLCLYVVDLVPEVRVGVRGLG